MFKSLSRMTIAKKLPLMMVSCVLISCAVTAGVGSFFTFHDAEVAAEKKMFVVAGAKTEMVQSFLTLVEKDIVMTSQLPSTSQAIQKMSNAWSVLPGNPMRYLQSQYMPSNMPSIERVKINQARDGSEYSALHGKYHPQFKAIMEVRNYYDIFLVDMKGNLVYSVYKEKDYATNLYSGQWRNTDLANAYKAGLRIKRNDVWISDLAPYEPSSFAPASFLSTPVYSERGKKVGVLIFQLPTEKINTAMSHIEGEEDSAVNYLVGADGYLRNNPWNHDGKKDIDVVLKHRMQSDDYKLAIDKGESGYALINENDRTVLTAYIPINFKNLKWAVVVHVDEEEIAQPILTSIYKVLMITAITAVIMAILSTLIARSISNPLKRQVEVMAPLSEGDYSINIPDQERGDEIGDIARAVQSFKENGMRVKQLEAEQAAQKLKAEEDKKEAQIMLAADFDSRVGGVIQLLSESADNMTATAQQMQGSSQQTADISNTVAAAATEADSNVQTVAAASEELAASSSEIARQIDAVAKKSSAASADAEATSESVNELNVLADSIGEVIGTIKDIAEQTNLLALNATIEAARAGEAGKGFAVVADEVKKLANETATKTEEIDERVNKIQDAIRNSVTAMDKIISNVSEIDAATTTVASAVEEQNAATAEIGRNVTEASTGTQQVSQSIIQVQQNAAESGEASNTVLHSASDLKKQSDILKVEVAKFLNEIRGDAA